MTTVWVIFFAAVASSAPMAAPAPAAAPRSPPGWVPVRQVVPADEQTPARRLARVLTDLEATLRIARICGLLAVGAVQMCGRAAAEVCASTMFRTVAVVELRGVIVSKAKGSDAISVSKVDRALRRAFACRRASAIVLKISSPGGTASESALLFRRIEALKRARNERPKWRPYGVLDSISQLASAPVRISSWALASTYRFVARKPTPTKRVPEVVAFVEDVCTSGAFYAACAADEIVASPGALIGSIGVVARSFGFARQLKMQGIERRLLTSGAAKADLDPFMPARRDALARERRILQELHNDFVDAVKTSRGPKLDSKAAADLAARADAKSWGLRGWLAAPPLRWFTRARRERQGDGLFDGSVHAARTALKLGLIDGIYHDDFTKAIHQRYGPRVYIRRFRVTPDRRISIIVTPPRGPPSSHVDGAGATAGSPPSPRSANVEDGIFRPPSWSQHLDGEALHLHPHVPPLAIAANCAAFAEC